MDKYNAGLTLVSVLHGMNASESLSKEVVSRLTAEEALGVLMAPVQVARMAMEIGASGGDPDEMAIQGFVTILRECLAAME